MQNNYYPMYECSNLVEAGMYWWRMLRGVPREMRTQNLVEIRQAILDDLNEGLNPLGFSVRTGWHWDDPLICYGRPHSYAQMVEALDSNAAGYAQETLDFLYGQTLLPNLSQPVQEFCLIFCFAEVARGFKSDLDGLGPKLDQIVWGRDTWEEVFQTLEAVKKAKDDAEFLA